MKFSTAITSLISCLSFVSAWEAEFYGGGVEIGSAGGRGRSPCAAISNRQSASSVTFTGGNGQYLLQIFAEVGCKTLVRTFANANDADLRSAGRGFAVIKSYSKRDEIAEGTYQIEESVDEDGDEDEEKKVEEPGFSRLEKRLPGVQCQLDAGQLIVNCQDCATSCDNGEAMFPYNDCCIGKDNCESCRQICYCT